jgi:hypothetical protein
MLEGIFGYQLFIVLTLVGCRVISSNLLGLVAIVWSVLSLIGIYWAPLMILQLFVVWITFFLLSQNSNDDGLRDKGSRGASSPARSKPPRQRGSKTDTFSGSHSLAALLGAAKVGPEVGHPQFTAQLRAVLASADVGSQKTTMPYFGDDLKEATKIEENPRPQILADILRRRNIAELFHFTRADNLSSILCNGLLSVDELDRQGLMAYRNDAKRLDGRPEAISVSVSFPNFRMFWKYRKEHTSADWALLILDPALLLDGDCAFCFVNAADHRIRDLPRKDLTSPMALEAMFATTERLPRSGSLRDCDPTDPQAEVLVFSRIKPDRIRTVVFQSDAIRGCYADVTSGYRTGVAPAFFLPRDEALKQWNTLGPTSRLPA